MCCVWWSILSQNLCGCFCGHFQQGDLVLCNWIIYHTLWTTKKSLQFVWEHGGYIIKSAKCCLLSTINRRVCVICYLETCRFLLYIFQNILIHTIHTPLYVWGACAGASAHELKNLLSVPSTGSPAAGNFYFSELLCSVF